jgi:DNA-binding LacI/PurR family transcriptional regulator
VAELGIAGGVYESPGEDFVEYATGYAARRAGERPTAFVAVSDNRALALMRDLGRQGIRAPQDVSVVGFDGFPVGAEVHPTLTSWRPHWPDIGRTGFRLLLELASGNTVPTRTLIGGELVERESSGAPPDGV